jgi:hypothetical protein
MKREWFNKKTNGQMAYLQVLSLLRKNIFRIKGIGAMAGLIIASLQASGQGQMNIPEGTENPHTTPVAAKKIDYSLSTGTSYLYAPGFAKGSTFYVAPEFKMNLSPKFKVDAGVMLSQNRFNYSQATLVPSSSVVLRSGPGYSGAVYANGNYAVNNKLTFTGSIYKDFSPNSPYQNSSANSSLQMMSLGVHYKLSDHISIGAGMNMIQSRGYNPYTGLSNYGYGPLNGSNPFMGY